MSYADATYYKTTFQGVIVPDNELDSYLQKASNAIDQLTYNRIFAVALDKLTAFQQNSVKMAVCHQAEHLYMLASVPEGVTNYSINGISMTFGTSRNHSDQALNYLKPTGLMYRGL